VTDGLSRRALLRGALAGGALTIGVALVGPACGGGGRARRVKHADTTGELRPNTFITILASGVVSLAIHKTEMGQGVTTAYATLVAEELEVEPGEIELHFGDAIPEYRTVTVEGVPLFAVQATGGSTSTHEGFVMLRRAAAAAREMLVAAAAEEWGVPVKTCIARGGSVHHEASKQSFGYGELTKRAARHAVPEEPRIKQRGEFRLIGKYDRRVDLRAKVTGAAVYGIDVSVPNMVHACPIHGPTFGARPREVRADAARKSPGVIDILAMPWGVAVVANKYWQARRAAKLVEVTWHPGRTAGLDSSALAKASRAYQGSGAPIRDDGNARKALRQNATLDAVYEAPYLAHAPLEPQNCTASVRDGKVEIWAPCQSQTDVQEAVGAAVDVPASDVIVHTTFVGGGFGRRLLSDFAVEAATIAKRVGRPVKLIWSRESDMTQGYYRPAATVFVRGAVANGRVSALSYHGLSQPITLDSGDTLRGGQPGWIPGFLRGATSRSLMALAASNTAVDLFAAEGASDTPYRIPNLRVAFTPIETGMPVASWRSVGHSVNGFVIESAMDELARAAGQDPHAFRRAHLAPGSRELRVLDAVMKLASGTPVAPGHARGIARHTCFGSECAEVAEVTIVDGRIRVTRVWCAVECGIVVNPDIVRAQLEGAIIFGLSAALEP
jgi:isoquinoline 1-oxidoreductase beta subunit